ncbi:hypothetical protein PMAYCL1PPCAC_08037, partial [Pristionchus mayeri]
SVMVRLPLLISSCFLLASAQLEGISARQEDAEGVTENDKTACRELKGEYRRVCADSDHRRTEEEFCRAFENVCIRL